MDGFVGGTHRSKHFGTSVDFAEHRAYGAGDDIRRIDWKLFARTDRFYVKQFEADTNASFLALVDVSKSMRFGSPISKIDYARGLAACLAFIAAAQKDRVGLVTFDRTVQTFIPPKAGRLETVLAALQELRDGEGAGELLPITRRVAEVSRRRGIFAIFTDLYEEPKAALEAIRLLRHRGSDVMVFHVLDPSERTFPYDDAETFEDLETGERVSADPLVIRDEYRRRMEEHVQTLRSALGRERVEYMVAQTDTPFEVAIRRFLLSRKR